MRKERAVKKRTRRARGERPGFASPMGVRKRLTPRRRGTVRRLGRAALFAVVRGMAGAAGSALVAGWLLWWRSR